MTKKTVSLDLSTLLVEAKETIQTTLDYWYLHKGTILYGKFYAGAGGSVFHPGDPETVRYNGFAQEAEWKFEKFANNHTKAEVKAALQKWLMTGELPGSSAKN